MNEKKPLVWFVSTVMAFCLSFGGLGCLYSAFGLEARLLIPGIFCALSAALFSLCCLWGKSLVVLLVPLLIFLFGAYFGKTLDSFRLLINAVSYVYSRAYCWEVFEVSKKLAKETDTTAALLLIGQLTAGAGAWTICRRKRLWTAAVVCSLPLALCLVVTDKVPSPGYLFLLLFPLLLLLLTQALRRRSGGEGARLALYLATPLALALLIMFLAVPRSGYGGRETALSLSQTLFGWQDRSPAYIFAAYDIEDSIDLTTLGGGIPQGDAMTVTSRLGGRVYLRGAAYDVYDGLSWSVSEGPWTLDEPEDWGVSSVYQNSEHISIHTYSAHSVRYVPHSPGSETAVNRMERGRVANEDELEHYSFFSTDSPAYEESWDTLIVDMSGTEQYLTLPADTLERAAALLRKSGIEAPGARTTAGQLYRTAVKIGRLVCDSAEYSLSAANMPQKEKDFALWFLENGEEGFCTHYACASAILLRAAGVPARYVSGYALQTEAGKETTVTWADSHAWVEYYIPGVGWLLLESTPPFVQDGHLRLPAQSTISVDTVIPQLPELPTVPTEPTPTPPPRESPTPQTPATQTPTVQEVPQWGRFFAGLGILALSLAAFTGLVILQSRLRLRAKEKARRRGSPNAQLLACWSKVELLSGRTRKKPPEPLLASAKKAKYSQHDSSPEELEAMETYLAEVIKKLRKMPLSLQFFDRIVLALY